MHPAVSVIFFTVTSGAGFGFLAMIGLGVPMPESGPGAFLACLVAGGLAVMGLISSTFHLGHPERAWRAISQWRSSWLSREGVCAIITLVLFGFYALFWVFFGERIAPLGILVAIGAAATVFTTSMIYAQLKTVPAWNTWMTPACYLAFSLTSGILFAGAFGHWQSFVGLSVPLLGLVALGCAWLMKLLWWQNGGRATLEAMGSDTGTATGLGFLGTVRLLEKPHSGPELSDQGNGSQDWSQACCQTSDNIACSGSSPATDPVPVGDVCHRCSQPVSACSGCVWADCRFVRGKMAFLC